MTLPAGILPHLRHRGQAVHGACPPSPYRGSLVPQAVYADGLRVMTLAVRGARRIGGRTIEPRDLTVICPLPPTGPHDRAPHVGYMGGGGWVSVAREVRRGGSQILRGSDKIVYGQESEVFFILFRPKRAITRRSRIATVWPDRRNEDRERQPRSNMNPMNVPMCGSRCNVRTISKVPLSRTGKGTNASS